MSPAPCVEPDSYRLSCRDARLERVDVELDGALEVCGLVLVHDVVLGQLVEHGRYFGQQSFCSALLGGRTQRFHSVTRRLVEQTVVSPLRDGLTNPLLR